MTRPEPACMTPDELARWHEANRTLTQPALRACQDCLVPWAVAMRREGRCNGEPGEPPAVIRGTLTEQRREANRRAQQRWRDRQRVLMAQAVSA